MEKDSTLVKDELLNEFRRRIFEEGLPRLKKCLAELTEEETWQRPNGHSNSMGNLVLHLNGNVRQWIVSGLGGRPDERKRQQEFDSQPARFSSSLVVEQVFKPWALLPDRS